MKAIYTTDEHAADRKFPCRTDEFMETFTRKLLFIDKYIVDNDIKLWLSGGDFFDKPHQNTKLINTLLDVFKSFSSHIFPIHIIPGNHIERRNPEKYVHESGLHTLQEAGYVKIYNDPYIEKIQDKKIMMHHITATDKPVLWEHRTYDEISSEFSDVDYFLVSHDHTPKPVSVVNGVMFVAPGSLMRATGTEENMHRDPMLAVINLTGETKAEYVKVSEGDYPFIDKPVSVNLVSDSGLILDEFKKLQDKIQVSTMRYDDMVGLFRKEKSFSKEALDLLDSVYNEVNEQ